MKKNAALEKSVATILIFSLMLAAIPVGYVAAKNESTAPSLDVRTNKEGQVHITPGEIFQAGDEAAISVFGLRHLPATPAAEAGLVAYYPFDGDTRDHSGSGNDATNYGATFTSGISGRALKFDGKDDYVSVPININPDVMPQMTMTAWARTDDLFPVTRVSGRTAIAVISHDNGGFDRALGIDFRGGGTGWSALSGSGEVLGYHPVIVGEWAFIAAVYDQNAKTVKLYINDAKYEESGSLGTGWNYLHIGSSPSFGEHFSGAIDEVRIYNYALSVSQIASLYGGGVPAVPTPPIPAPPAPAPPSQPPPGVQEETAKIDAASAIELDALIALRMSEGLETPDLNMDADGDGEVTKEDARLILKWSVTSQGEPLSPSQQKIVDTLGSPSHFSVTYLLDSMTESDAVVRTEVWFYPMHQKKITFIAGDINSVDDLPPLGDKVAYSNLKPEDFDCFMNYEQVAAKIGGTVGPAELLPEAFTEVGMETYLGDNVLFMMADGNLVHIETFGAEGQLSAGKHLSVFLTSLKSAGLITTSPVLAKGPDPKQALRWLWKQTKKGARFVRMVPEKVAEAILPSELVPFAVGIAEAKLGHLPAWRTAAKINDVTQMESELKKVRDSYRKQAKNVGDLAKTLKAEQDRLNQGPTKLGMDVLDWQKRRKLLDELIPKLDEVLTKLNRDSDRLNIGDIARIGLGDIIQKTLGNVEKIILREINQELHRLGVENVIRILLEKGPKGLLDANTVIDLLINGDISRMSEAKGLDPTLKDRIREEIKNELKRNRDHVLKNWQEVLQQTMDNILAQRPKTTEVPEKEPSEEKKPTEEKKTSDLFPTEVEFPDRTGKFRIRLSFPYGEGEGYEKVKIDSADIVKVKVRKRFDYQTETRVKVEVVGVPETGWLFYYRWNLWDAGPQSRSVIWDYSQPKPEHPRLQFCEPTATRGHFYCVQLNPESYGSAGCIFVLMPTK